MGIDTPRCIIIEYTLSEHKLDYIKTITCKQGRTLADTTPTTGRSSIALSSWLRRVAVTEFITARPKALSSSSISPSRICEPAKPISM